MSLESAGSDRVQLKIKCDVSLGSHHSLKNPGGLLNTGLR